MTSRRWGRGATAAGGPAPRIALGILALALVSGACGDHAARDDGIERETFVEAWVDLRTAALRHGEEGLPEAERTRILAEHDLTEEDLLRFAEAHGDDVAFMKDVWDEIEVRLQERGLAPGRAEPGDDPGSIG